MRFARGPCIARIRNLPRIMGMSLRFANLWSGCTALFCGLPGQFRKKSPNPKGRLLTHSRHRLEWSLTSSRRKGICRAAQGHFSGPGPTSRNLAVMSQSAKVEHQRNCSQLLGGGTDLLPTTRFRGRKRGGPRTTGRTHGLVDARMAESSSRYRVCTCGRRNPEGRSARRATLLHPFSRRLSLAH